MESAEIETNVNVAQAPGVQDPSAVLDEFEVDLGFFAGPMDLLLHLVSQREVSILEVPMKELLDQYLDIVSSQAASLDLEKASEYLVIAATLLQLKSKSLLPQEETNSDDADDLPEYTRFFENLRQRLIAYETTRQRAKALIDSPQLGVDTFYRKDKSALEIPSDMIAEGDTADRLGSLFVGLLSRVGGFAKQIHISIEPISVVSYMMKCVDVLKAQFSRGPQSFFELCRRHVVSNAVKDSGADPRSTVLGSFIAVLELAKRGLIELQQTDDAAEIKVELKMQDVDNEALSSEFDEEEKDPKIIKLSDYQEQEAPEAAVSNAKAFNE